MAVRPEERPKKLGILFVHGMGEQERGDTITQMGDALTEWLRRWIGPCDGRDMVIREATLRDSPQVTPPPEPNDASGAVAHRVIGPAAHATVGLIDTQHAERDQQWLLAESWWADAFRQATFGELVTWAVSVGPWLIASQRQGVVRRVLQASPGWAGSSIGQVVLVALKGVTLFGLYVVALVLAGLIAPLAILLLIVGMVPIPVLSGLARGLAHNLAGSFGDLLVLVRSPVRFAAMAERVRRDLVVMGEECETVIVVAHSQGTAVSWHAIRRLVQQEERLPNLARFVTFGQALRKLKSLYRVHEQGGGRQVRATALAFVSTALLIAEAWLVGGEVLHKISLGGAFWPVEIPGLKLLAILALAVLIIAIQEWLGAIVRDTTVQTEGELRDEFTAVRERLPRLEWIDLWASADPAPNGPLLAELPEGIRSYKLRNLASTLLDHSVYWSNVTEFVSTVAFAAAALVSPNPLEVDGPIPEPLVTAARVRDRRVSMLAAARVVFFTGLVVALYGLRHWFPEVGHAVLGFASSLPLVPDLSSWDGFWEGAVALALLASAGVAAWFALAWAWGMPIRTDEQQLFSRGGSGLPGVFARVWFGVALAIPTAAILVLWRTVADVHTGLLLAYVGVSALLVVIVWSVLQAGGDPLGSA